MNIYPNIDTAIMAARQEVDSGTREIIFTREKSGGWSVTMVECKVLRREL